MICLVASMNVDYPCKIKDCTCNIIGINIHPCALQKHQNYIIVIVEELKNVLAIVEELKNIFSLAYIYFEHL